MRVTGICMLSADAAHATQPHQVWNTSNHRNTTVTASTHLNWSFFEPRRRQLAKQPPPLLIGRELLREGQCLALSWRTWLERAK